MRVCEFVANAAPVRSVTGHREGFRRRVEHRLTARLSGMLVQLIMAEGSVLCGAGEVWRGGQRSPVIILADRERKRERKKERGGVALFTSLLLVSTQCILLSFFLSLDFSHRVLLSDWLTGMTRSATGSSNTTSSYVSNSLALHTHSNKHTHIYIYLSCYSINISFCIVSLLIRPTPVRHIEHVIHSDSEPTEGRRSGQGEVVKSSTYCSVYV